MTFLQRYSHPKVFSEKLTGVRSQPLTEFSNFKQKILQSNALFIKKVLVTDSIILVAKGPEAEIIA